MAEGYSFPLKLWEETADFKQKKKEAEQRFKALDEKTREKRISGISTDVRFTKNCVPVVWRNSSPPYWIRPQTADHALELAQLHGSTNYVTAEEVEDYLKGEGFLIESAMDKMGFRRHKRDETKWARKTKQDGDGPTPLTKDHWERLYGTPTYTPGKLERERLMDLRVGTNVGTKHGETYSVEVGNTGMVYLSMDANPFWYNNSTMHKYAIQDAQKAHINPSQEGFKLEARNVRLNRGTSSDRPDGVHILAVNRGGVLESVWPVSTPGGALAEMATDLRERALAQNEPRHQQIS